MATFDLRKLLTEGKLMEVKQT